MNKMIFAGIAVTLGLIGCATDPSKDPTKLEFVSTGNSTLAVGETSPLWVVSKTFVELGTGKTITTNPYTSFTLVSSDTNVAAVINHQQLIAKKTGSTEVTAFDDKDTKLTTDIAAKITVLAAP
ncbi:MAG: hypothetical protein JWO30_1130 [Fibrobacteres bacterium]|nr:hypothetical protein [Fibrobacterota bacterium]